MVNNLNALSAIEFKKRMKKQYGLVEKIAEDNGRKVRVYGQSGSIDC
jgi:hypothetical protein